MLQKTVITMLTDFGTADYFVAAMKGVILSAHPDAVIVDISHEIPPHDIATAAFTLLACSRDFPPAALRWWLRHAARPRSLRVATTLSVPTMASSATSSIVNRTRASFISVTRPSSARLRVRPFTDATFSHRSPLRLPAESQSQRSA